MAVSAPSSLGIERENWLRWRLKPELITDNRASSLGMVPSKELPQTFKVHFRPVSAPNSDGSLPVNFDFWRFKDAVKSVKRPISAGVKNSKNKKPE